MKEFIEKLIGRLEEREVQAYAKMDGGVTYQTYRNAIEIVNQLAEEYKELFGKTEQLNNDWIPVSDRLPKIESKRDVWITLKGEYGSYRAKWHLDHFEWENGLRIKEGILAWMPNDIPEPYQPKGE